MTALARHPRLLVRARRAAPSIGERARRVVSQGRRVRRDAARALRRAPSIARSPEAFDELGAIPRHDCSRACCCSTSSRATAIATRRAFAGDRHALLRSRTQAVATGDRRASCSGRALVPYMPFQHAGRCRTGVDRGCSAARDRAGMASMGRTARRDIRRFGRFPHRNAILGRLSTPDEIAFLRHQAPASCRLFS